jgi:predicted N-acetyltransferase YhbS
MPLSPALPADLPAVAALVNAAYRGERAQIGWTTEAAFIAGERVTVDALRADLDDPAARVLVLRDDAGGFGGCVRLEIEADGAWLLGMLAVPPEQQAKGTGRAIIEGAEVYAKSQGARAMRMQVITIRDSLIAWYQRQGYADTGERAPYTYNGALRADLQFATFEKAL